MQTVHYTPVAKFLHWAIMALVIIQFLTAWIMPGVRHNQTPGFLLSIHMSFGVTIIALMIVRFIWRFTHAVPPVDETLPQWQNLLARLTHVVLYWLLVLVPLFGWAWASTRGWPVNVFGLYTLPPILSPSSPFAWTVHYLHSGSAVLLLSLIGFHILAALYHQHILRDDVMKSMMPRHRSV